MRPIGRASRVPRPITPRGSRRSSRSGRLGSAGSSRPSNSSDQWYSPGADQNDPMHQPQPVAPGS